VVFVHGFACDHTDWRHQIEALQHHHCVVACDLHGHGRTPGQPEECSIEHYGARIAELLEALNLGPAVLVGHSLGCRVVLETAHHHAERVAGLVFIEGNKRSAGDPTQVEQAAREHITTKGYAAFSEAFFASLFPNSYAGAGDIMERAKRLPPEIGTVLFSRMTRWDAEMEDAALAALRVALLDIQSTRLDAAGKPISLQPGDTTPWLEHARQLVPHLQIEIIPGVGHFAQLEAPERINALLLAFVARVKTIKDDAPRT
jgi:pimeloyl-ACP methyl ester carboxylesterase